jgi:hypothetical protein
VLALVAVLAIVTLREVLRPGPGCTTALGDGARQVTVEQAESAATIAGVGMAMGMPDHAVTVALATAFYAKLRTEPDWPTLSVTEAAQLVQRSATPEAYARWEPMARSLARALTGEDPAAMTCHSLTLSVPGEEVAEVAAAELGTARLSGAQPPTRGWAIATWLVAHAARLGLESVTYDGRTWTAEEGAWSDPGPSDGVLSLRRAARSAA